MVRHSRFPVFARQLDIDLHTLIHRGKDRRVGFGDRLAALDRIAGTTFMAAVTILSLWLIGVAAGMGLLRIPSATADSANVAVSQSQMAEAVSDRLKWSEIRTVQAKLTKLGFEPGTIDGIAGRRTLEALNRYRSERHLDIAGRVDRVTAADLLE